MMHLRIRTLKFAGLVALSAMLLSGSTARAEFVEFFTTGTFDDGEQAGTEIYEDGDVVIFFDAAVNNSLELAFGESSSATLGFFDTSLTTAESFQGVSSGFTLNVFQSSPSFGVAEFIGSLTGELRFDGSQAWVQFDAPLTQAIGAVLYEIVSADQGQMGRVNLSPPTVNDGVSSIQGQVTLVPEPSAVALMALGLPGLMAVRYRNRKRVCVEA